MIGRERSSQMQSVSDGFFKKLKKENPQEFKAAKWYSMGKGPEVNGAIYNRKWENGPFAKKINLLDTAIQKYPVLDAETWFFKGDNSVYWADVIVGQKVIRKGFLSTSTNKRRAESDINENSKAVPYMVVIKAKRGTNGLYIGANTAYDKVGRFRGNEYEYLFPRNSLFRVLEKYDSHIVLETIIE